MIHKHRTVPCCISFIVGLTYELIENMKILAEKIVVGNDLIYEYHECGLKC